MSILSEKRRKWGEASKKWRREHPNYYKEYLIEYRAIWRKRKREQGLCDRCGRRKSIKGLFRCYKCRWYHRSQVSPTIRDIRKEDRHRAVKAQRKKRKTCSLCRTKKHNGNSWHIDHSHKTKKFRGVLCQNCNIGLGHFRDSIQLLMRAISYLRRTS